MTSPHITLIIEKAKQGGYDVKNHKVDLVTSDRIFMDIYFWKSLSKACDWQNPNDDGSVFVALRFHEINLTESWDAAIKYLAELLS